MIKASWITVRFPILPISFRVDRRVPPAALILGLLTIALLVFSINYGQYNMSPLDVVQTLLGLNTDHPDYRNYALVVHTFRLPRILVAFMVGAALATAGTLMQGLTRNPLADPYLLGVSGGASIAAVAMIVWLPTVPTAYLPFAAFFGGVTEAALIVLLGWKRDGTAPMRLILIGIGMGAMVAAITTTLLLFGDINDVQQAYVWLTGSVYGRTWDHVTALAAWLLIFMPLAFLTARALNLLNLGDDTAKGLGVSVERTRLFALFVSVALTAAAVAIAGTIGFVGLIAPHICRRLVGPAHEGLLPISALFGGLLVVSADLIGRWVIAPSELPVGIVTAMIGAPYFALLLIRSRQ
jgi:iron complex transport system permease protein